MFFYYTPANQPAPPQQQQQQAPVQVVPISASTTFSMQTQQPATMDQGDPASAPDITYAERPPVTRGIASTSMTRSRAMTQEQDAGEAWAPTQDPFQTCQHGRRLPRRW